MEFMEVARLRCRKRVMDYQVPEGEENDEKAGWGQVSAGVMDRQRRWPGLSRARVGRDHEQAGTIAGQEK